MGAIAVFNHKLSAFVSIRIVQKHRGGYIGAYLLAAKTVGLDRVVNVVAVVAPALVAVKHRRQHGFGQHG